MDLKQKHNRPFRPGLRPLLGDSLLLSSCRGLFYFILQKKRIPPEKLEGFLFPVILNLHHDLEGKDYYLF